MRTSVTGVVLFLALGCLLAGCSEEVSGSVPAFQGRLSDDYDLPPRASLLDRAVEMLVGGTAYAAGGATVDTAVLLSLSSDMLVESPIDEEGRFSFTFDREVSGSWIILLICRDAPLEERVVGYVTMGAGDDTMLAFPPLEAALDVGTVSRSGDEAVSPTDVTEVASRFTLSAEDLLAIAASDDSYKFHVNRYLNHNRETGTFYNPKLEFIWSVPFTDDPTQPVLRAATPEALSFTGYILDINTNDPGLPVDRICDGTVPFALRPPSAITTATATVFGPELPLRNDEEDTGGSYCARNVRVAPDGGGGNALNFAGGYLRGLADGYWTLEVADRTLAAFDLGVADPNAGGQIQVPVPMPRLAVSAEGVLGAVTIEWYLPSRDGYARVEDPARLGHTIHDIFLSFDIGAETVEYPIPDPGETLFTAFDRPVLLGAAAGAGTVAAEKMAIGYRVDSLSYSFVFGRDYGRPSFTVTAAHPFSWVVRPVDRATELQVRLHLDPPASIPVTLDYATADGTATVADGDYVAQSGTLTFAPGESTVDLMIPVPPAGELQPDETFYVDFTNSSGPALDTPRVELLVRSPVEVFFVGASGGSSTISSWALEGEDLVAALVVDPPAPFPIEVPLRFDAGLWTAPDSPHAEPGVDHEDLGPPLIRFAPMQTRAELRIPTFADTEVEGTELVVLTVDDYFHGVMNARFRAPLQAVLAIADGDPDIRIETPASAQEGAPLEVRATTGVAPVEPIPLTLGVVDVRRSYVVSTWTESFPAGATEHVFTVSVPDDGLSTGDYPTLLRLLYTRSGTAYSELIPGPVVLDDDVTLTDVVCRPAIDDGTIDIQLVTATLSGPGSRVPASVPIRFETVPGTATEGVDYRRLDRTVEHRPGDRLSGYVQIINDEIREISETYEVRFTAPGLDETVTCTIYD